MNGKLLILVSSLAIVFVIGAALSVNVNAFNLKLIGSDNTENMEVTQTNEEVKVKNVSNGLYGDMVLTIDQLKIDSVFIVLGKVIKQQPHPSGLSSFSTVIVQKVIKGEVVDTLEVLQLNDQYLAEVNGTYVFFLKKNSKGDHYFISGGLQGIMKVDNGAVHVSPTIEHNVTTTLQNGLVPLNSLVEYLN